MPACTPGRPQEALRGSLRAGGVVGFVINGAILPRESGNSDRPMDATQVCRHSTMCVAVLVYTKMYVPNIITKRYTRSGIYETIVRKRYLRNGIYEMISTTRYLRNGIYEMVSTRRYRHRVTTDRFLIR